MPERCPVCESEPADVSWQTAPGQLICPDGACPVNSWGGVSYD
jgi:hypothetical protein